LLTRIIADGGAALVPSRDRDPSEGPQLFDSARLALVALDRLTHGARVGEIAGPSLQAELIGRQPPLLPRDSLGAIDRLARWTEPPAPTRPADSGRTGRLARVLAAGGRPTIHEHEAKRVLAEAGLPVVAERLVTGLGEAHAAAVALGYPIALKVVSDDIPHRSELGLVAVGLRDERELAIEWERMSRRLEESGQRGTIAGFVIQELARDGLEVFAGVSTEPDWGPVLAFGAGGVLVEALADVALRPLPLKDGDAEAMIAETRAGALLAGYRGRPPGDVLALARCLTALADFAWAEREHVAEIDVNPIVVRERGRGCVVVDALIVPRPAPRPTGKPREPEIPHES
jgi:acetate---CoA ligase (ADP-forming)